jgi:hypothetical protein
MKQRRRRIIIPGCLLLLAVGAVLLFFFRSKSSPSQRVAEKLPPPSSQNVATVATTPTPDTSIYKTDPRWISWNEQNARDPSFEWKMPINFFGKIVDESGNPVSDTRVNFTWTDLSPTGTSTAETLSDLQGLFSLTNKTGKFLEVRVKKAGYYAYEENRFGFEYAAFFEDDYYQPDSKHPVIFRLRKKGEVPQQFVVRHTLMGIKPTGESHYIDLQTTRKSTASGGDIAISITRTAPENAKQYDWCASIEGVNGAGLIESNDEFMFEAPETGYKPGYLYRFAKSDPSWKNQTSRKYFVRAKDGKIYGRLEIAFIPKYQDTGAIDIKFYVNPTGSRNLEYEPNTVLPR